jgi:hypothetical protein
MTSPAVQFSAQLTAGVRPDGIGAAAGALVIEACGTANTLATSARMTVVYFIVIAGVVRFGTARCVGKQV